MAHVLASGTIAFGLVSIPVRVYTAASSENVSFNLLHAKCGSRVQQQMRCPVDDEVVDRKDMLRGYEHAPGQFVTFSEDELRSLRGARSTAIELVEFVPEDSVDLMVVEGTYWLGPDKAGEKAYSLLAQAMRRTGRVAVGRYCPRDKEEVVLIRPYGDRGLQLHTIWYAEEIRDFGAIWTATEGGGDLRPEEYAAADGLIASMSRSRFDATRFENGHQKRLLEAINAKAAGKEVTAPVESPKARVVNLLEALQRSVAESKAVHSEPPPAPDVAKPKGKPRKAEPRDEAPAKKKGAK